MVDSVIDISDKSSFSREELLKSGHGELLGPGNAQLPRITLLDIHNAGANQALSKEMLQAIRSHLEQGSQVLLFLNRRGYAPILLCNQCDWKSECPRCDTNMTLFTHYGKQRLRCHHCGAERPAEMQCSQCEST